MSSVASPGVAGARYTRTVFTQASQAFTTTFTLGPFDVSDLSTVALDVNVSAVGGTGPSLTITLQRQNPQNAAEFSTIATSSAITATGNQQLEAGTATSNNKSIGAKLQAVFTISGTGPSFTLDAGMTGKP